MFMFYPCAISNDILLRIDPTFPKSAMITLNKLRMSCESIASRQRYARPWRGGRPVELPDARGRQRDLPKGVRIRKGSFSVY